MADSTPPKTGGLWARLFGVNQADEPKNDVPPDNGTSAADELLAEWDAPPAAVPATPPVAVPLAPVAEPAPAGPAEPCPSCQTPRKGESPFCEDCGWLFGPTKPRAAAAPVAAVANSQTPGRSAMAATPVLPAQRIRNRYELGGLVSERAGLSRCLGRDHGNGTPVPVTIVWGQLPEMAEPLLSLEELDTPSDEILPTFEDATPVAMAPAAGASWPSIGWEKNLLEKADHPALPQVVDHFVDNNFEYLILEAPQGASLWDAWDDPEASAEARYGWLKQIAEGLHALHQAGAIVEGLRPDIVTVTAGNQAMLSDLSDLLPVPMPANPPIRATLYTAPELILSPQQADARADLYSFGAMLYALEYLHHALEEKDFEHQFSPKLITDRYPDVHPLFFRLVSKTFVRDPNSRFPTDEAQKIDATGFTELINTLDVCRRTFERVRLDIAAWTTTGMVRTGNEDAFAFLHGVESRQDDQYEYAMVLLADGMGGYEAGEVAAALAISELRKYLLQQPQFSPLAGGESGETRNMDVPACKKVLESALKHANKQVFTAARTPGKGRRGMGCTAEAVYVDAHNVVVGHVGDSRTYHLHNGRLIQLTRDQTLVNRLVELGQLTEEEAEHHDRKNELQQAIGGQPDVVPGLYSGKLKRGDWVLVCSDGLTNHIPSADLEKMLTREASGSAEEAARRLLNLVNLRGATDNATIVVVRAT